MYVQITTRCNMSCEHCGFACNSKGEDMSIETFMAALEYCAGESIEIGGGEPTIHPKFLEMLLLAICECEYVWLATNGSVTKTALMLCKLARKGVIGCDLSQDRYHDPIDGEVSCAFMDGMVWSRESKMYVTKTEGDYRGIRDVGGKEANSGRFSGGDDDGCVCPGPMVKPNGDVVLCGCDGAPKIGDVFNGYEWDQKYECVKDMEEDDEDEEDRLLVLESDGGIQESQAEERLAYA